MLVANKDDIRLAMIGMVEGNGHPYSWSAIINGEYDAAAMAKCGYPAIPEYLGAQPRENLGIRGVRVTHVWCDDKEDARRVSKASRVPNVVAKAEDVIGDVDAVIIATDIGSEHLERARPFIEADIPLFIDKPLTDRADHLKQFIAWHREGNAFMSSSCMRYSQEYAELRKRIDAVGDLRLITITMAKTWERYGIHALEAVYPFFRSGVFTSVTHTGTEKRNIMHLAHEDGVDTVLSVIDDLYGCFGHLHVFGTEDSGSAVFSDTFFAFKAQLEAFVDYLRTGAQPFPFEETVEQMKIIVAGLRSRDENGRTVFLEEIED